MESLELTKEATIVCCSSIISGWSRGPHRHISGSTDAAHALEGTPPDGHGLKMCVALTIQSKFASRKMLSVNM